MQELLRIQSLKLIFKTYAGQITALNDFSMTVQEGEAVGIVGESGSGKSAAMLSVLGLLSENAFIAAGEIFFQGNSLTKMSEKQMRSIRGNEIGMIFQDPMSSLNPLYTVGNQLMEAIRQHHQLPTAAMRKKAVEMLQLVGISSPESRLKQYPHEFSGGMRQRVMIAMALCGALKLLIADEPTTALDVTIQAQILELLKGLKEKRNTAIILITHDLRLVAKVCERVMVMYGGTIIEEGQVEELFDHPLHPYTKGLIQSLPRQQGDKERLQPIEGQPPDMLHPLPGCLYADRCKHTMEICLIRKPVLEQVGDSHHVACWLRVKEGGGHHHASER